jgi:hypothetical protein
METPIMLVVTIVVARSVVLRFRGAERAVCPAWDGVHRARPSAHRGIRARALASGSVDQRVSRYARPSVGNGLLCDACGVCSHAASRGQKMRLLLSQKVVTDAPN